MKHYLTTAEVASFLNVSPATVRNWRRQEIGPEFDQECGRYRARRLFAWLASHLRPTPVRACFDGPLLTPLEAAALVGCTVDELTYDHHRYAGKRHPAPMHYQFGSPSFGITRYRRDHILQYRSELDAFKRSHYLCNVRRHTNSACALL